MMNRGMFLLVAVSVALMVSGTWAGPIGPELLVSNSTDAQWKSSIDMDETGSFVIAWEVFNYSGGGNFDIYAKRFDSSGTAVGSEFRVNTQTWEDQTDVAVGMTPSGNFVIVWQGDLSDGNEFDVYAQRYNSSGMALGSEFVVNTYRNSSQEEPSIAMDGSGNFVIAWESAYQDGFSRGVYAQRYDAAGLALGSEFQVNTYTTSAQGKPSVGMDLEGNFVIAWESSAQDGDYYGIYAQRYDALGNVQGAEFQVNTYTTGSQSEPSVGMSSSGGFVIAWEGSGQDGDLDGIYAQRYDASGSELGGEFQVNTYTADYQENPSVGMDGSGNFVIAWHSNGQDGNLDGVFAQRYSSSGVAQGSEFQVNTQTAGYQGFAAVGMNGPGNCVITWTSVDEATFPSYIYAQRYEPEIAPPSTDMISAASSSITEGGTLAFDVTFSVPVTGVDISDFALFITGDITGASILSVTGSGSEYTVLVGNVAGDGTLRLDLIDDDSIVDGGGNPLGGSGIGNGDFTAGEAYHVVPELPIAVWPMVLILLAAGLVVLHKRRKAGQVS